MGRCSSPPPVASRDDKRCGLAKPPLTFSLPSNVRSAIIFPSFFILRSSFSFIFRLLWPPFSFARFPSLRSSSRRRRWAERRSSYAFGTPHSAFFASRHNTRRLLHRQHHLTNQLYHITKLHALQIRREVRRLAILHSRKSTFAFWSSWIFSCFFHWYCASSRVLSTLGGNSQLSTPLSRCW